MKKTLTVSVARKYYKMKKPILLKKADISINIIIMAVLALIVLVILIFIFSNKINLFGNGVSSCAGKCVSDFVSAKEDPNEKCGAGYTYNPVGKCLNDKGKYEKTIICCVLVDKDKL